MLVVSGGAEPRPYGRFVVTVCHSSGVGGGWGRAGGTHRSRPTAGDDTVCYATVPGGGRQPAHGAPRSSRPTEETAQFAIHRASLPHRPLIRHGLWPCHLLPEEKAGWDLPPCAIQLALPAAVTGFGRSSASDTLRRMSSWWSQCPWGKPRPYIRSSFLPHFISPRRSLPPGCGRFVNRPYNMTPPPGWPGGGTFCDSVIHAKWRSKLPVVDTPSSTMTKAWGSISAMAWRREAISYLFRHTHSTCTGLSVKPP